MPNSVKPKRIVVLFSGSGTNLQALIDAVQRGEINGTVCAAITNNPAAPGIQRAQQANIPLQILDHKQFDAREVFDQALAQLIDDYAPDLVVLAGYMRILSCEFVRHYAHRLLNIHPSLLPKYKGLNTHQRALDAGDREHGCSIHFVTDELDGGPVFLQAIVPIQADDSATQLAQRVQKQEHIAYPLAVSWFCDEKIAWHGEQLVFDGQPLSQPIMLDDVIQ
jgi:phosphoribosylglycinamide formyltransferase-1